MVVPCPPDIIPKLLPFLRGTDLENKLGTERIQSCSVGGLLATVEEACFGDSHDSLEELVPEASSSRLITGRGHEIPVDV